jgi:hypothetical protein
MPKSPSTALTTQPARIGRVVRGLLRSESRPRYVAAARRRLTGGRTAPTKPKPAPARPARVDGTCSVCLSQKVHFQQVTYFKNQKSFLVQICRTCGYVANPDNVAAPPSSTPSDRSPVSARVGTDEHRGREFHMAKLGVEILGRPSVSVLVVSPGRSLDHRHIAKLAKVRNVHVGDVVRRPDQPGWLDVFGDTQARFDLIIASEVIQGFSDPGNDFPKLFRLLDKDGLFIGSTNIYDGGDLSRHNYLYIRGHTSYYSPKSIERLAADNAMSFDFRVPVAATTFAGPRKRYVFFTNSPKRLAGIARYFGSHTYAPSEK